MNANTGISQNFNSGFNREEISAKNMSTPAEGEQVVESQAKTKTKSVMDTNATILPTSFLTRKMTQLFQSCISTFRSQDESITEQKPTRRSSIVEPPSSHGSSSNVLGRLNRQATAILTGKFIQESEEISNPELNALNNDIKEVTRKLEEALEKASEGDLSDLSQIDDESLFIYTDLFDRFKNFEQEGVVNQTPHFNQLRETVTKFKKAAERAGALGYAGIANIGVNIGADISVKRAKARKALEEVMQNDGKIGFDAEHNLVAQTSSLLTKTGIGERGRSEEAKGAFLEIVALATAEVPHDKALLMKLATSKWGNDVIKHHPSLGNLDILPKPKYTIYEFEESIPKVSEELLATHEEFFLKQVLEELTNTGEKSLGSVLDDELKIIDSKTKLNVVLPEDENASSKLKSAHIVHQKALADLVPAGKAYRDAFTVLEKAQENLTKWQNQQPKDGSKGEALVDERKNALKNFVDARESYFKAKLNEAEAKFEMVKFAKDEGITLEDSPIETSDKPLPSIRLKLADVQKEFEDAKLTKSYRGNRLGIGPILEKRLMMFKEELVVKKNQMKRELDYITQNIKRGEETKVHQDQIKTILLNYFTSEFIQNNAKQILLKDTRLAFAKEHLLDMAKEMTKELSKERPLEEVLREVSYTLNEIKKDKLKLEGNDSDKEAVYQELLQEGFAEMEKFLNSEENQAVAVILRMKL